MLPGKNNEQTIQNILTAEREKLEEERMKSLDKKYKVGGQEERLTLN